MQQAFKALLCLGLFFSFHPAHTCDSQGKSGIVADNDLWLGPEYESEGGITEEQFMGAIDRAEAIYGPIIKELGKKLVIERNWTDGTVNAYARQSGDSWIVSMFGGLARHETVTLDGFTLVICHELGHHLGGAPKRKGWFGFSSWASNEGQSDYWGAHKCMQRLLQEEDNLAVVAKMEVDPTAKSECEAIYSDPERQAICLRSAHAGLSLANLFKALRNLDKDLKFTTPDPKKVSSTNDSHPAPQCRLDTYFQGALCDRPWDATVSKDDPDEGFCSRKEDATKGIRPLCWFAPAT